MTKGQAIQEFFSSFDLPAYPLSSVPDDVIFPYLTYQLITDAGIGNTVTIPVSLWFYTESEAIPNAKAAQISAEIDYGGTVLQFDGGAVWVRRGTPWCRSERDDTAPNIKLRTLNVELEYISAN